MPIATSPTIMNPSNRCNRTIQLAIGLNHDDAASHHSQSSEAAPLSAHKAFVVHLVDGESLETEAVCGRVEHVVSGRYVRFTSITQLIEFMQQAVTNLGNGGRRE